MEGAASVVREGIWAEYGLEANPELGDVAFVACGGCWAKGKLLGDLGNISGLGLKNWIETGFPVEEAPDGAVDDGVKDVA